MSAHPLRQLAERVAGRVSFPGDSRYAAATAIWPKPVGRKPRAIVHCRTPQDVQFAVRAARAADLPLSVRGGGHDWAGRALCDGIVIDLREMNDVLVGHRIARIGGGARAADVVAVTDPRGLAVTTGAVGSVGMTGFTLGGGYGPLISRAGLAVDNLLAAEVVLADGSCVIAKGDSNEDLLWALRGGGGNFGVVVAMHHRLHEVPSVRSGMIVYPFMEAKAVLQGYTEIAASAPDELSVSVVVVSGGDGSPVVMIVPTWCGRPEEGEAKIAPLLKLGTLLGNTVEAMTFSTMLGQFDSFLVDGQREHMETCWLPALDGDSIDVLIEVAAASVSPGCAIITHDFKGAASRVPVEATAFGLRRDHVLIELLATFADEPDEAQRHQQWGLSSLRAFGPMALPGGYPNLLGDDPARAAQSFGVNAGRLVKTKRRYDPDNLFRSAIPLPARE
jgi:FAD/FMN-containing dehydrogenase